MAVLVVRIVIPDNDKRLEKLGNSIINVLPNLNPTSLYYKISYKSFQVFYDSEYDSVLF